MKERAVNLWAGKGRMTLGMLLIVVLAGFIILPKLGSLVPSTTSLEQPSSLKITEIENLIDDPFFLPERVIQAGFVYAHHGLGTYLRLVSVGFAIIALVLMYWLLSKWHTRRVAFLSVLMFCTSSWFLHQARWAEPDVLYLTAVPALLLGAILLKKKRYDSLWPITVFVLSLLLYLPGLWALVALFLVLNYRKIGKTFKYLPNSLRTASIFALILPLLPLVYSLQRAPWLLPKWLGLPDGGLSFRTWLQNLYEIPKQLFITGPNDPLRWLSGTPILDVITIALIVIGIYSYSSGLYPVRWRILGGISLVSIFLISLGGPAGLSLLIPVVYIFAANGLALLLQQWFTVFPRNPFARSIGITTVVILVLISCTYQITRYYVAWPHSPDTYRALVEHTP